MADSKQTCIFCGIVRGEIPAAKVFENELLLAFLDIGPLAPGHLLVIPKEHSERIWEMDGSTAAAIAEVLPRLAKAVLDASGAEGCNVLQSNGPASGQEIDHLHFHIIPRRGGDGLGYRWRAGKYGHGEIQAMQAEIAASLA
ncbi:MAG: HIT family protein [Phycisphaerae bacterium]|nr:HIT family protein [Phycisphaerae bacterium]